MAETVLYFDGRFDASAAPRLTLDDRGYLLGDGVFATLRGYDGACFRTASHLADLACGAGLLGIALPIDAPRLAALCDEAATRTGAPDAYVRVTLTRGGILSVLARAFETPSDDDYASGIAAAIVGPRRAPPECLGAAFARVKTTSYVAQLVARREAEARGAREAIQLAIGGDVACGAMANVFVVKGTRLVTPALASGCRDGVTRRAVLGIARSAGLDVREERLDRATLVNGDEAFFTSTRVECLPIATIDGVAVGSGVFPRTAALRRALRDLARSERSGGGESGVSGSPLART